MTNEPYASTVGSTELLSAADAMPQRDRWSTRAVVLILGGVLVLLIGVAGALLMSDRTVPSEMWTLIATDLGAVGALLSSTRTR